MTDSFFQSLSHPVHQSERDAEVWRGTPYLEICRAVLLTSAGSDRASLKAAGDDAFGRARDAHRDGRRRLSVQHLCHALAYLSLSGEMADAAIALTNMGGELSELGNHPAALRVQERALLQKTSLGVASRYVVTSLRLIARSQAALGRYVDACAALEWALSIAPGGPTAFRSELEELIAELSGKQMLMEEVASLIGEPVRDSGYATLMASPTHSGNDGEHQRAIREHASAVAAARSCGDSVEELASRLRLADLLQSELLMHHAACDHAEFAARTARQMGDADAECKALLIKGRAATAIGMFRVASDALEIAFSALAKAEPSATKCDVAALLGLSYLVAGNAHTGDTYLNAALQTALALQAPVGAAAEVCLRQARALKAQDFVDRSLPLYKAALELAIRNGGPPVDIANLHEEVAHALFVLGKEGESLEFLNRGLSYSESAGDVSGLGRVWIRKGWAYVRLKDYEAAQRCGEKALDYVAEANDEALRDESVRLAMALTVPMTRRLADARHMAEVAESLRDAPGSAKMHRSEQTLRGEMARSIDAKDWKGLVALHCLLASVLERQHQIAEAVRHYLAAFHLARSERLTDLYGTILHDYGVTLARRGRFNSARRAFALAVDCKSKYAAGKTLWSSLLNLAQVQLILGKAESPEGLMSLLGLLERELNGVDSARRASALQLLARLYARCGRPADALQTSAKALEELRESGARDLETLVSAVNLHLECGAINVAKEVAMEAWREAESWRGVALEEYRRDLPQLLMPTTWSLLDVCFALGREYAAEALRASEHAKMRSLLEHYGEELAPTPAGFPEDLREEEKRLVGSLKVARAATRLMDSGTLNDIENAEHEARAMADLRRFWSGLPTGWREYGDLRQGRPPSPCETVRRAAATTGAHFLVFVTSPKHTYVWHLNGLGEIESWSVAPLTHSDLSAMMEDVGERMCEGRDLRPELATIAAELVNPHLDSVPPQTTLCIVPGGPLFLTPFGALPLNGGYLIERNPLVILPSLSILAYWESGQVEDIVESALVLGDSLGDLPGANEEARAVGEALSTEPLMGRAVLRHEVQSRLASSSLLHVAGHAFHEYGRSGSSGFYLADNTVVSARDLLEWHGGPKLAVLSACESGRVHVKPGDELSGLGASLLYAGVKSVVSTLWPVADRETTDLVLRFYHEASAEQGHDLAVALQRAQCWTLSRSNSAHPRFWAAFELWGQWRTKIAWRSLA